MRKMDKKGIFSSLSQLGIGIVALAITLVVVFVILSQTASNTTVAADPNATYAIGILQGAADDIPTWVPIVVIAVIGGLLIGLVAVFRNRA